MAAYAGTLAIELVVSGTLPKGKTTQNLTYFIVEKGTKTVVAQVILPDASEMFSGVDMRVSVGRLAAAYDIGTVSEGAFRPVDFLTVRHAGSISRPGGPRGAG